MSLKINVITLGCSKNVVDSEFLTGHLRSKGYVVEFDSNSPNFDVVIVNTCGFIGDAKEESIDMIIKCCYHKEKGKIGKIIVCGCLSQRYKDDLEKELPLVDAYFGVFEWEQILKYLDADVQGDYYEKRHMSTPKHYAYLKISEGCDRNCSYCAIPIIRGKNISRPMPELIEEAKRMVAQGVKEIIVVAQDTTYYGLDLYQERKLAELLREIAKIEGLKWIRLQYTYPHQFPMDVIELMKSEPKICNYIDMPLQHINTEVLTSMKRNIDSDGTRSLVQTMRNEIPDVALRTTFIVGYPNETEQAFEELKDFITEARFERMGVFTYSPEEGTSAYELGDTVSEQEKQRRLDELTEIQQEISLSINQSRIGKEMDVVIDRDEGDYWAGRTEYDSPEVDNEVIIHKTKQKLEIGEFYKAKIVDAVEFDLIAEII